MINYQFIGWCHQENHDKVWVMIQLANSKWLTVWGRRGKTLQTKILDTDSWTVRKLIDSKAIKGYRTIQKDNLNTVYPEFEQDLSKTTSWTMLTI